MNKELIEKVLEFDKYFTSANNVDVNAQIQVPTKEWREIKELISKLTKEK